LKKCGYIDKKGSWVLSPQYQYGQGFTEDIAAVRINGLYGYIDKRGAVIIEAKYRNAWHFSGGLSQVETADADGYPLFGYLDKMGVYVWGPNRTSLFP
jgi:hypothetical protein